MSTKQDFSKAVQATEHAPLGEEDFGTTTTNAVLEAAVANRADHMTRLLRFLDQGSNRTVLTQLTTLLRDVEEAEAEADEPIRNASPVGEQLKQATFTRGRAARSNVYDPQKLPAPVLLAPGVIKTLNHKKIDELVLGTMANKAKTIVKARSEKIGSCAIKYTQKCPPSKVLAALLGLGK